MSRIPVLSGALGPNELEGVLDALSLTRQLTCVEVTSPLGALEGSLWMKSGQLLEAAAGSRTGLGALRFLLDRQGAYEVFRVQGKVDGGVVPLMPLEEAIERARALPSDVPHATVSTTGMQPISSLASVLEPSSIPEPAAPPAAHPVAMGTSPPNPVSAQPDFAPASSFANGRTHVSAVPPRPAVSASPAHPQAAPSPPTPAHPAERPSAAPSHLPPPPHLPPPHPPQYAPPPAVAVPAPVAAPVPRVFAEARDPHVSSPGGPVLAVFANKGGVGKTTFAVNLAVTIARRGMRAILVDADPRNDVGTALAARRDTSRGLFDVLDGSMSLRDAIIETALPGFSIVPAGGVGLSEERFQAATMRGRELAALLAAVSAPGAMVIVDTPPGLRGITNLVLRASTHALAVVQAEPVALRSAVHVPRALDAMPARERPALVGVALNMLDRRVGASLGMLEEACNVFGAEAVLDIAVPRSGAFLEASETGSPVALLDGKGGNSLGWIFESLASSVLARAGLEAPRFAELRLL